MKYLIESADLDAESTYRQALYLRRYEQFCTKHELVPYPATLTTIGPFLESLTARVSWYTLLHYTYAIRREHSRQNLPDPLNSKLARASLRALERHCAQAVEVKLRHTQEIAAVLDRVPHTPIGARDTILFLLAYCIRASCAALSEMNRSDVYFTPAGMRVRLRYGRHHAVITIRAHVDSRYCAVAAMRRYLNVIDNDEETPLFRRILSGAKIKTVRVGPDGISQALAFRLRDPDNPQDRRKLRSLHASMIATAKSRGASDHVIMRQLGYRHIGSVRAWNERHENNACGLTEKLGL